MKKAVFLDRDGVINDGSLYYTWQKEDFKLNPTVGDALALLQKDGWLLIVVTNQGGIAKGQYTCADVDAVHEYMQSLLSVYGVQLDAVYYCPHHSDIAPCKCRKPGTLMLEQAIARFDIDVSQSYLIGDSSRDIEAAHAMNIHGIKTNKNEAILPYCQAIVAGTISK